MPCSHLCCVGLMFFILFSCTEKFWVVSGYESEESSRDSSSESSSEEDDSIPAFYAGEDGIPGVDFPNLAAIPKTAFSCGDLDDGYYADVETGCQVFHICLNAKKVSFLCPNGTVFQQQELICDWWFKVNCSLAPLFYEESVEQLRLDNERRQEARRIAEATKSVINSTPKSTHFKQETVFNTPSPTYETNLRNSLHIQSPRSRTKQTQFKQGTLLNNDSPTYETNVRNQFFTSPRPRTSQSKFLIKEEDYTDRYDSQSEESSAKSAPLPYHQDSKDKSQRRVTTTSNGKRINKLPQENFQLSKKKSASPAPRELNLLHPTGRIPVNIVHEETQEPQESASFVNSPFNTISPNRKPSTDNPYPNHKKTYSEIQDVKLFTKGYSKLPDKPFRGTSVSPETLATVPVLPFDASITSIASTPAESYEPVTSRISGTENTTKRKITSVTVIYPKEHDQTSVKTDIPFDVTQRSGDGNIALERPHEPSSVENLGRTTENIAKQTDQDSTRRFGDGSTAPEKSRDRSSVGNLGRTKESIVKPSDQDYESRGKDSDFRPDIQRQKSEDSAQRFGGENIVPERPRDRSYVRNLGKTTESTEKPTEQDYELRDKDNDFRPDIQRQKPKDFVQRFGSEDIIPEKSRDRSSVGHLERTTESIAKSLDQDYESRDKGSNFRPDIQRQKSDDFALRVGGEDIVPEKSRDRSSLETEMRDKNSDFRPEIQRQKSEDFAQRFGGEDIAPEKSRDRSSTGNLGRTTSSIAKLSDQDYKSKNKESDFEPDIQRQKSENLTQHFGGEDITPEKSRGLSSVGDLGRITESIAELSNQNYKSKNGDGHSESEDSEQRLGDRNIAPERSPDRSSVGSLEGTTESIAKSTDQEPDIQRKESEDSDEKLVFIKLARDDSQGKDNKDIQKTGKDIRVEIQDKTPVPSLDFNVNKLSVVTSPEARTTTQRNRYFFSANGFSATEIPSSFQSHPTEKVRDLSTVTTTPTEEEIDEFANYVTTPSLFEIYTGRGSGKPRGFKGTSTSRPGLISDEQNTLQYNGVVFTTASPRGFSLDKKLQVSGPGDIPISSITGIPNRSFSSPSGFIPNSKSITQTSSKTSTDLHPKNDDLKITKTDKERYDIPDVLTRSSKPLRSTTLPTPTATPLSFIPEVSDDNMTDVISSLIKVAEERLHKDVENYFSTSRPGLVVPPSVGPQTLHSLALYFANISDKNDSNPISEELYNNMTPEERAVIDLLLTQSTKAGYDSLFEKDHEEEDKSLERVDHTSTVAYESNDLEEDNFQFPPQNTSVRELARIFTSALSSYLNDPTSFRKTLQEVRPTEPPSFDKPDLTSSEDEEVLNFSDSDLSVKNPSAQHTTTGAPYFVDLELKTSTLTPWRSETSSSSNKLQTTVENNLLPTTTEYFEPGYITTTSKPYTTPSVESKPTLGFVIAYDSKNLQPNIHSGNFIDQNSENLQAADSRSLIAHGRNSLLRELKQTTTIKSTFNKHTLSRSTEKIQTTTEPLEQTTTLTSKDLLEGIQKDTDISDQKETHSHTLYVSKPSTTKPRNAKEKVPASSYYLEDSKTDKSISITASTNNFGSGFQETIGPGGITDKSLFGNYNQIRNPKARLQPDSYSARLNTNNLARNSLKQSTTDSPTFDENNPSTTDFRVSTETLPINGYSLEEDKFDETITRTPKTYNLAKDIQTGTNVLEDITTTNKSSPDKYNPIVDSKSGIETGTYSSVQDTIDTSVPTRFKISNLADEAFKQSITGSPISGDINPSTADFNDYTERNQTNTYSLEKAISDKSKPTPHGIDNVVEDTKSLKQRPTSPPISFGGIDLTPTSIVPEGFDITTLSPRPKPTLGGIDLTPTSIVPEGFDITTLSPRPKPTLGFIIAYNRNNTRLTTEPSLVEEKESAVTLQPFDLDEEVSKSTSSFGLPEDHWTTSSHVTNLLQSTLALNPISVNRITASGKFDDDIDSTEIRSDEALDSPTGIVDSNFSFDTTASQKSDFTDGTNSKLKQAILDIINDTRSNIDDHERVQQILKKLNISEEEFLEKMKEIESNPLAKRLVLLLINKNKCDSEEDVSNESSVTQDEGIDKDVKVRENGSNKLVGSTNSFGKFVDEELTDANEDTRALELLNSLYIIASKYGK